MRSRISSLFLLSAALPAASLVKPAALPLAFEANLGQAPADVKFLGRAPGETVGLTERGLRFALGGRNAALLDLAFCGASVHPDLTAEAPLPGQVNDLGGEASTWRTHIPTTGRVRYHEVYPCTDLVVHGREGRLEYDWILHPGADPAKIHLEARGAQGLRLDAHGDLLIRTAAGEIRQTAPLLFQVAADGHREPVEGRFKLMGSNRIGFQTGPYDASRDLVIDPTVTWSTLFGGNALTSPTQVAIGADGSVFVAGVTSATNLPVNGSAIQTSAESIDEGFLAKLSSDGQTVLWCTYLGNGGAASIFGLALDSSGLPVIAGWASSQWPTTTGAYQATGTSGSFVAKISADGSGFVFSTMFHGPVGGNSTTIQAITLDASDAIYATGLTYDPNFPTTAHAYQTAFGGGQDAFVAKFAADGTGLVYSTFLGGTGYDSGVGIAVDASGSAYAAGYADDVASFPQTSGAYKTSSTSGDGFVAKLSATPFQGKAP